MLCNFAIGTKQKAEAKRQHKRAIVRLTDTRALKLESITIFSFEKKPEVIPTSSFDRSKDFKALNAHICAVINAKCEERTSIQYNYTFGKLSFID